MECSVIGIRNTDGKKIYNITIDNIHCNDNYAAEDGKFYPDYPKFRLPKNDFATAFDFDINEKPCKAENVVIHNAFLGNCKKIFNMKLEGAVHYSGLHGANVEKESGTIEK